MSKVKVKKIKVPVGIKDEGLAEMFNQMLGTGAVNISIAYPRYKRIKAICDQITKIFELLAESPFMRLYQEFSAHRVQITKFCAEARHSIDTVFDMDLVEYEWNLNLVDEDLRKTFSEKYEKMKKSTLISTFIIMCDKLVPYKKNFSDIDHLNHKFITTMAGVEWMPFPFTNLNIKHIFGLPEIGDNTITFFMTILCKAYEMSRKLYEEIQSPDIDVDQFVDFIMKNIDKIKKQPKLSRCDQAFNKIKESVSLLKDRFNGYYRDFISTKDSTIIMQHFIIDVSKNTDADAVVTHQFRKIINFYKEMAREQITDPNIKMLFDKVNDSFKELERGTENLVNIRDEDSNSDVDSDPISNTSAPLSVDDLTENS